MSYNLILKPCLVIINLMHTDTIIYTKVSVIVYHVRHVLHWRAGDTVALVCSLELVLMHNMSFYIV